MFLRGSSVPRNRRYPRSGRRVHTLPSRRPGGAHDDAGFVEAERVDDVARRERRRHDDEVGAPCVIASEPRVVAANLARGALRAPEKVEVVNRHHLHRVARRHQERVGRVRDVHGADAERLHGRPLEPVPGQVEEPHRHAAIDDGGRRERTAGRGDPSRSSRTARTSSGVRVSALASSWTYSPTPVRSRRAGR